MRDSIDFRRCLRHIPGEGDLEAEDALHDLYRGGRVSIRYTAERGLEYLGTEADRLRNEQRRR